MKGRRIVEAVAGAIAIASGVLLVIRLGHRGPAAPPPVDTARAIEARIDSLAQLRQTLASAAILRQPAMTLFGLYDPAFPADLAHLDSAESQLGAAFPIVSFSVFWGDDQPFPTAAIRRIEEAGSVAMITWEPRVTNFESTAVNRLPPRGEREYRSLAAIARGAYDFYVGEWAAAAARHRGPIFVRFARDMNDPYRHPWGPQNGNRAEDFITAWRHVRLLFDRAGATNVVWIWSPQIGVPHFEYYYPGQDYVDWVGVEALNQGTAVASSRWWSLTDILDKGYPILESLHKPIMITEFGTVDRGGDPAAWYADAFYVLHRRFDGVRALILLHRVLDNKEASQAVAEEMLRSGVKSMRRAS